jgi:hypothetical protein
MSDTVTLERVEQLAVQLPPREQLKLVAHVSEWLIVTPLATPTEERGVGHMQLEQLAQVDAWIAQCNEVAELWEGEFDSAADLRRIRDEG